MTILNQLKSALHKRDPRETCLRVFHGPGEGSGLLKEISIDKFGEHAWISFFGDDLSTLRSSFLEFCSQHFKSAAVIMRKRRGDQTQPAEIFYGEWPGDFSVTHQDFHFEIRFQNQRHPGLFLDMDFARRWLKKNSAGLRVLNLFSYTGSLSVASGIGKAKQVTSVDLSKSFTSWARKNWELNQLPTENNDFIYGDVFEWLTRFKKQGRFFDLIVCDPPSFSRTKKSHFSTEKDSRLLHQSLFEVLEPGGLVLTSINSEKISRMTFENNILEAARISRRKARVLERFSLPSTFPSGSEDSYLKGAILQDMRVR